jgi:type I restriction enzyme, S subunit
MLSAGRETLQHSKPYLRNRDVQWGRIETANLPVMDFKDRDADKYRLLYGDLLVCEGGEVGRAAVWLDQLEECYYQKALHRIRCSAELDVNYLRYLLEHYKHRRFFDQFTTGTTIDHLPQEDLRNLPIPLPPIQLQREIVSRLESELSVIEHQSNETLDFFNDCAALRASILTAAFSGQLVPQDSSDEPASILLERIAADRASPNGRRPRKQRMPQEALL